ncbi:MAG TPA: chemotaxis protein CheB [Trichormus sp.]|jgi:two-component system chemotaxis response regulator CheB
MPYNLIMIGCSLGGLKALQTLLAGIPHACNTPIIIVQHRDRDINTGGLLSEILQKFSGMVIEEAEDKTPIVPSHVYLAPADYHLLVEHDRLELSTELPVAYARPSIDVAFESAARCYGESLIGVILTGAGSDGAIGLSHIERRGGVAIVQDPNSAEQPSMPRAAIAATKAAKVLPLDSIATYLCSLNNDGDRKNAFRATR